ncbi:DsbE family thiol:disulfide interchange protein [Roseibaca sp. Y0-43]|uniref:DsbE family thiol:disulfide interchange protein n=1 Tax=Roseibaca sp. Y0-43 TaxID=2816854 RepID=UPI001D0C6175|nr:DsbE family thiol:disulfide interchange protein [Roseibaca sp. Y0-43]MCC1480522.1 DsbE family thiol:disulfide interchange protein [Roseibaca sp. Y0-43]
MGKIRPLMFLPPLLFLGLAALFLIGNFREGRDELPSARAGQQAPALGVEQLGERTLFTDDMLREGEVTLVNFWATWCPPCRAEHPFLEELSQEGTVIYGVNYRDQADKAEDFLDELGDPFRAIGSDPAARTGLDWGVVGLPETFVVAGDGTIEFRYAGPITREIMETRIRPAMEAAAAR